MWSKRETWGELHHDKKSLALPANLFVGENVPKSRICVWYTIRGSCHVGYYYDLAAKSSLSISHFIFFSLHLLFPSWVLSIRRNVWHALVVVTMTFFSSTMSPNVPSMCTSIHMCVIVCMYFCASIPTHLRTSHEPIVPRCGWSAWENTAEKCAARERKYMVGVAAIFDEDEMLKGVAGMAGSLIFLMSLDKEEPHEIIIKSQPLPFLLSVNNFIALLTFDFVWRCASTHAVVQFSFYPHKA